MKRYKPYNLVTLTLNGNNLINYTLVQAQYIHSIAQDFLTRNISGVEIQRKSEGIYTCRGRVFRLRPQDLKGHKLNNHFVGSHFHLGPGPNGLDEYHFLISKNFNPEKLLKSVYTTLDNLVNN